MLTPLLARLHMTASQGLQHKHGGGAKTAKRSVMGKGHCSWCLDLRHGLGAFGCLIHGSPASRQKVEVVDCLSQSVSGL